jgi:SAM-dependent methyltransferase
VNPEGSVSVESDDARALRALCSQGLHGNRTTPDHDAECEETTKHYLELATPDAQLISFRYVRPWLRNFPVLDLGCAKGSYLRQFRAGSLGIDISKPNLEHCRGLDLHVKAADLNRDLPIPSGSFQAILCSHALEHVDAPIHLLRECRRILGPAGKLVLGLPIETSLVNWLRGQRYFYHHPGHLYSFSLENIDVLLQKTGFTIIHHYFEPRIVRLQPWLSIMQRLPAELMYPLALAFWVVAEKAPERHGLAASAVATCGEPD